MADCERIDTVSRPRNTDRIVVLADGRLVEEGSHEALLRRDGVYAGMYRLQASWYAQPTGGDRDG